MFVADVVAKADNQKKITHLLAAPCRRNRLQTVSQNHSDNILPSHVQFAGTFTKCLFCVDAFVHL